jgi:purine nucleoside phosphorylase
MNAFILGSGFTDDLPFQIQEEKDITTPYGQSSLLKCSHDAKNFFILFRHGKKHSIPPHQINELNVKTIYSFCSVGSIFSDGIPGSVCIPSQIIDYTWGRSHTFFENDSKVEHIDFTHPFSIYAQTKLTTTLENLNVNYFKELVYGVTQGPRLETAAEIKKYQKEGCDIIGMTAMPECSLAKEIGVSYAILAFVVNWCAGINDSSSKIDHSKIVEISNNTVSILKKLIIELI